MNSFEIVSGHTDARVAVRGRRYLAGADYPEVPVSIPMANDSVLALRMKAGVETPAAAANLCRGVLDDELYRCGGIHLSGLPLKTAADFSEFIRVLGYPPCSYQGGIAVRNHVAGYALVASNESGAITMAPHNELAYLPTFPRKILFFCAREADRGGEVPISDIRQSVKFVKPEVLAKFRDKEIRYYRHLPRENCQAQIGWMETFGVTDCNGAERLMEENGYDYHWLDNDTLCYSYINPAFVAHPDTGEELWFNQVTELHSSYWRRHPDFASDLPEEAYPATTRYGDGTPIDPDLISSLRAAIWKTASAIKLRQGEILALDNLVVQHGRFDFEGPRLHMVAITH